MSPSFFCFLLIYLMSFLFVINMDEWFLIWFGLEMNMLSFIVLIYQRNSMINVESCMKYFFIQSLGSVLFLSSFYLNKSNQEMVSCLVLGYKMGGGPFYFWFPSICSGISWGACYFIMTSQKFLPMVILSKMLNWGVWVIIVASLLVGVYGSINQNNIKWLMSFSSINQVGWLVMFLYVDNFMWMVYYFIYMVILWPVISKFSENKVGVLVKVCDAKDKWWMVFMFLNMGGMPPMLGFFLKWMSLYYFMKLSGFVVVLMIFMSVVMFYVYLRVCYNIILSESIKISWGNKGVYFYYSGIDIVLMAGMLLGGVIVFTIFL